jgi:hypothetical protein
VNQKKQGDNYLISKKIKDRRRIYIKIVEKAIGKKLPVGAIIHHADGNRKNNNNNNLIICQNENYHKLLHARERALKNSGNSKYRPCCRCHNYDSICNLVYSKGSRHYYHKECSAEYTRRLRYAIKQRYTIIN